MKANLIVALCQVSCTVLLATACGKPETPATLTNASHDRCVEKALKQKADGTAKATLAYESDAAACYGLMDDQQYLSSSLCLKKAESARKEAMAKVEAEFARAMDLCEPR